MLNSAIKNDSDVSEFYDSVRSRLETGDTVQNAISLAYRDLQRTLRGFNKIADKETIKKNVFDLIKNEYEKIFLSVIDGKSFDKWHRALCSEIKCIFGDKYNITYGQAQKWINMFLKYMYLVDERTNSVSPFFHIPIDNVILDGIEKYSCYFSLQKSVPSCRPWSRLDDYDKYLYFQKEFKRMFRNPLLHEFRLWNKWRKKKSERFEDLTAFLSYFANTKQEFYSVPPPEQETENGQTATITVHLVYTKECEEFLHVVSRYPVYNYSEILNEKGLRYEDITDINFKNRDAFTILTFLTAITRSMRFGNESDLGEFAECGIIYNMLSRLKETDNEAAG